MWQRRAAALVGRAILRRDRRGPRDSRAVTGTMGRYATAYQRPRRTPIEPNAPALTTLRLAPRGCVGRGLATLMLVAGMLLGGGALIGLGLLDGERSEEHTSELQSRGHLVCRLLLETRN